MSLFERPKSLTELVETHLREGIVTGRIDLGSHLSEARIAAELQVSRTPVREALNRLSMEGLVLVEPQRGTFVFNLPTEKLAKLCDARVALETAALRSAIEARPADLIEGLKTITARMTAARQGGDVSTYLACDTAFHQCLFDCSDNEFLADAYQTIAPKMASLRNRLGRHPDHMAKSYREHLEILDAVRQRNLETSLRILEGHIDRKEGSYWQEIIDGQMPVATDASTQTEPSLD